MILLEGALDYAGLFPPAGLGMDAAVRNYAEYRRGPHRALLGRFVVPAARLEELDAALAALPWDAEEPLELSVLLAGEPGRHRRSIADFLDAQGREGRAVSVASVERKVESLADVRAAAAGDREPVCDRPAWRVYLEVAAGPEARGLVTAIGAAGVCAKVRTGAVTAQGFPAPDTLAHFVLACAERRVPFKATAGLHHALRGEYPLTYERDSPRTTMHGFLNLFVGAALLHAGAIGEEELGAVLEERDPNAFRVGAGQRLDEAVRWRERAAGADDVRRMRARLLHSFGSCSFAEPVAELRALGALA